MRPLTCSTWSLTCAKSTCTASRRRATPRRVLATDCTSPPSSASTRKCARRPTCLCRALSWTRSSAVPIKSRRTPCSSRTRAAKSSIFCVTARSTPTPTIISARRFTCIWTRPSPPTARPRARAWRP
ncbi:ORFL224W.iORF1 [Human betaherpesvirus 5]|nr:ORFL224W.iORF1 [Human betaherpesvirus 5]QHX40573.1 ORFL224W.iORF1 [Human betaherpesvirus 5]